ncbi:hypothetical protein DPMN_113215 [Dreissena polymorpha]|uniref:Uncharacterized protein n=1 Tax=Dreissena polymorpha TaxID=45954 RepID=A0A9D4KHW2_DREPO|nr:hypothetical protein DPMN_113215 [Dreissena polymorpha]
MALVRMKTLARDNPQNKFCVVKQNGEEFWSGTIWFKAEYCAKGSGGKVVPKNYIEPLYKGFQLTLTNIRQPTKQDSTVKAQGHQ